MCPRIFSTYSVTAMKHYAQNQLEQERVYFSLLFMPNDFGFFLKLVFWLGVDFSTSPVCIRSYSQSGGEEEGDDVFYFLPYDF